MANARKGPSEGLLAQGKGDVQTLKQEAPGQESANSGDGGQSLLGDSTCTPDAVHQIGKTQVRVFGPGPIDRQEQLRRHSKLIHAASQCTDVDVPPCD